MTTSHSNARVDAEVDAFVARVSTQAQRSPLPAEAVPDFLRVGSPDALGHYGWRIASIAEAPWLPGLEARFPIRLPPALRSLLSRYAFPAIELETVRLLANTGQNVDDELGTMLGRDPLLTRVLTGAGFVPFARSPGGRYDPLCFDLRKRAASGDFPVVRLDHEAALIREEARVIAQLAPSFRALLAAAQLR